jgi:urea transporter
VDTTWPTASGPSWSPLRDQLTRAHRRIALHFAAIAQTFFVGSARVGLVSVAVLAVVAPRLAAAGLIVSVAARLCAVRFGAAQAFLDTGLVELNGWFLGMCCATFFSLGVGLVVALVCAGPLIAVMSIVMRRVLATWDLPLLVGPYLPAFWLFWAGFAAFPWAGPAALPAPVTHAAPATLIVLGGLRGVGQIFFVPDALLGAGIAVAATLYDRRLGAAMVTASIAAVGLGYLADAPDWQVEQGLAGFTPALVAAAALRGFVGLGRTAVFVAMIAGPFLEAGALRVSAAVGLPALGASYIGLVWTFALLRPVRDAAAARSAWSMGPGPAGSRPRLFED